jgi:hypothetical protein
MEEARGFVVIAVQRKPRDDGAVRSEPIEPRKRQRCLAEPRGRLDDGEPPGFGLVGQCDEPWPVDQAGG